MMKINLGSGAKPIQGFANIDKNRKSPNVNLVCDLDLYPWPFKDESVDEICI
jgi:predicted SAM-dependent methyltransferase